jgi:hypothetical protein
MSTVPVKQPVETIEQKSRRLAETWYRAVGHHSSSSVLHSHLAYQEIISMGPEVVPLLLRDLEDNHSRWYYALHAITGANPVPPEDRGRSAKVREAWLRWGRENGYRWRND